MHFDAKTGKELDERTVAVARKEEIEFMRQIKLYDNVGWVESIRMTGRPPVSTKWVEVDKGTAEKPDVRCRLVARDFRVKGEGHRDDLFAAMPPSEAKKLLFKMAAATWKGRSEGKEPDKIMLIDVKKGSLERGRGGGCVGMHRVARRMITRRASVRHAPGSESMGGRLRREVGEHRVTAGEGCSDGVPPSGMEGAYCRAR